MPRITHEALVQLVRRAPELVLSLIWPEGHPMSASVVHVTAGEFVDLNFAEHHADVVLALGGAPNRPDGVLVVEAQVQIDAEKRNSWPVYTTGLRSRLRCPAALVVLAPDRRVAAWCAERIDVGWGQTVMNPWVYGPDDIPIITDLERARAAPELAVLSVAAHADEPIGVNVALTAMEAARDLDGGRNILYIDLIFGLLGPHARTLLEKIMSTAQRLYYSDIFQDHYDRGLEKGLEKGKVEGKVEGKLEGKLEGKVELLLRLLALKGIPVADPDRQRILACTDPELLDLWAGRVLTATEVRDVLGPA